MLVLAGCAAPLDASIKAEVRTISLELKLADKPVVASTGTVVAALLGPLVLAGHLSSSDLPTAYKEVVARNVDVAAEIRQAARAEMERKGYRVVDAGQSADARLVISGNYGIGLVSLVSTDRGVATTLNAQLMRGPHGNVLWRKTALGLNADAAQRGRRYCRPSFNAAGIGNG